MKRKAFSRGDEVTIRTTIEIDVEVVCHVSPGRPERGPSYSCGGEPAEPPEVEILAIHSEDGAQLNGLIDELSREDLAAIEEAAFEAAADAAIAGMEDAAEAAREAREER